MKGYDISHWQGQIDWTKVQSDFVIAKATQGVSMFDSTFIRNRDECRKRGILFGSYHFANGGDAVKEAEFYVSKIGDIREGELLVLDYEINMPGAGAWCRKFLDRVTTLTGVKPLLYTNEARVKTIDWKDVVSRDYGLWVAKYGLNLPYMGLPPSSGQWPFWAIWQYSSRGKVDFTKAYVDLNYTKMDLATLKKYGKHTEEICTHCCPIHCT